MNAVNSEYIRIQKNIEKWRVRLIKLQSSCMHPDVAITYNGSTGNFDPIDDGYYKSYKCPDCNKYWSDDE